MNYKVGDKIKLKSGLDPTFISVLAAWNILMNVVYEIYDVNLGDNNLIHIRPSGTNIVIMSMVHFDIIKPKTVGFTIE